MNPMELLEALSDVDDEALLRAEMDPPRRRRIPRVAWRAAAACMALVLALLIVVPSPTVAEDMNLHWMITTYDDMVVYHFYGRAAPEGPVPMYNVTWLPEGCVLDMDLSSEFGPNFHYRSPSKDGYQYSFYCRYVGTGYVTRFTSQDGPFTVTPVTVQGIEGHSYRYPSSDLGFLVWIDQKQQICFELSYSGDLETALRVAESVQLMEGE